MICIMACLYDKQRNRNQMNKKYLQTNSKIGKEKKKKNVMDIQGARTTNRINIGKSIRSSKNNVDEAIKQCLGDFN